MLLHNFTGKVGVTLTSADLPHALEVLNQQRLAIYDVVLIEPYRILFNIHRKDLSEVEALFEKRGESVQFQYRDGWIFYLIHVIKRPVILTMLLILLFLTCWLPSRVLFVRVEGNTTVPDKMILEKVRESGMRFLASRRGIRNEDIKNSLLEDIPQLQWVGINTYGCTATITVCERNATIIHQKEYPISSMIALCDGVVREVIVEQGTAQCRVGQAVKKGQTLVSGYTDCGIFLKGTNAKAEVFADTIRKISISFPQKYHIRYAQQSVRKKYSVIIGKKRINFFKGSGISGASCAKIYEEKYFTLPGGFVLPIGVIVEKQFEYQTEMQIKACDSQALAEFATSYLLSQLQSGRIHSSNVEFSNNEDCCSLSGTFYSYEMIGMTHIEERVPVNE